MTLGKLRAFDFTRLFVAAFALIYISGYTVEFAYYNFNGITNMSGDVLKLKYIYTGIVFVLFFLVLILPVAMYDVDARTHVSAKAQGGTTILRYTLLPVRLLRVTILNLIIF